MNLTIDMIMGVLSYIESSALLEILIGGKQEPKSQLVNISCPLFLKHHP